MNLSRAVWAEINLDNLAHNMRETRRIVDKNTKISAVIKADGYGHGAVYIAQTLLDNGADKFSVATLSEAIQLRKKFPTTEIMVLGYTPNHLASEVIKNNIIQTIYSIEQAKEFSNIAKSMKKDITVHIKIDSGMNRLGMLCTQDTINTILEISKLNNIIIEGIFTHFAVSDEVDKTYTKIQVKKFNSIIKSLEKRGLFIPIKHVSNSGAIIDLPEFNFDMVRAGIMLYGLYPSNTVDHKKINLKEVMCLKAKVAQVKTIESGSGISYGLKHICKEQTQIATLPIGYADGFTRMLSGKIKVLIKDKKVPVLGTICMDQCIIDVTNLNVKTGDEVVLFGGNNKKTSIDSVAKLLNTINYEIVCMVKKRVPRLYIKNNKETNYKDYILMIQDKLE
jgi:alanine racemase